MARKKGGDREKREGGRGRGNGKESQEAHYPRKYGRLSSPRLVRDDRTTIFAVILFFSVAAPFKRETASPFRDFMTNLFNDRRAVAIYGRMAVLGCFRCWNPRRVRYHGVASRRRERESIFFSRIR